jgi:hypothetical protein
MLPHVFLKGNAVKDPHITPFGFNAIIEAAKEDIKTFSQTRSVVLHSFQALLQYQAEMFEQSAPTGSSPPAEGLVYGADPVPEQKMASLAHGGETR